MSPDDFLSEHGRVVEMPKRELPPAAAELPVPAFSDEDLALEFAAKYGARLRYVAAWAKWLEWDGTKWCFDTTLQAFDHARAICRAAAIRADDPRIASAKTVSAIERLAEADRAIAATTDQWDADTMRLNTPGGVVDLRTGTMRPHRPDDYVTKIAPVAPGGDCLLWREFLHRICGEDEELVRFLQRMAGHALTGSVAEHALFFAYGTGANGKSVFVNTLMGVMGDYATTTPMETFMASPTDRHPTELADLRGARLVAATETEQGRRWAESRIKSLTGGDRVKARFMRQDFFEFAPQFKLLIAGNHKPALRGIDEAISRRMNLIPFNVTIPAAERDNKLPDKLREEWPGILQWAIEGCLEWQRDGLAQPLVVRDATAAYLESEDAIATWMAERCKIGSIFYTTSTELYIDWKKWADSTGEFAGSQKRFSQALMDRGFNPRRSAAGRGGFDGIGLRLDAVADGHYE